MHTLRDTHLKVGDGNKAVAEALHGRNIAVSVITELEVKGYHRLQKDQEQAVSAMF